MSGVLYLASRYLAHHRVKTAVLVTSITLIFFIPVALRVFVSESQQQLTARAEATPLLVGVKGSPLELVLNSLYYSTDVPETLRFGEAQKITDSGLARGVPLYVRFRAGRTAIVGTSLDYFDFRGLKAAQGSLFGRLGDCVVGARVAEQRGLAPGGHVVSSPETVFDLAGAYPLKMLVRGVLAPSGGPDDDAIFVDVRTAWVIEGLAHGHEDLSRPEAANRVLKRDGNTVIGNASVVEYREITDDNMDSFHFHGDRADFPITAVLAVARDVKSATLLMGRYEDPEERHQIVRPVAVMDELLDTILTVERFVVAALVLVGIATLATASLVFVLSMRLRRREIETMVKIGGSRLHVAAVVLSEIVLVLAVSAALAGILTWITSSVGAEWVRSWIM